MSDDAHKVAEPRRTRLFWRTQAPVYRAANPPDSSREVCGVVNARASLQRLHRGGRGIVKLVVKPAALDEAIEEILQENAAA